MAERGTIGKMQVGSRANIYTSRILATEPLGVKWLDPADLIYDAPGLGAQVERTTAGFTARVRYGSGSPTYVDLKPHELEEMGYIPIDDFQSVGYLWPNS